MNEQQTTGMPVAQPAKSKKGLIIGIIIALLVLVGGYFLLRSDTTVDNNQGIVAGDQNSITVGDQDADSVAVLLSNVQLRQNGFVVIHEDANGQPGVIVGSSSLLQPGNHNNVSVIAKLSPGKNYWAMLHSDNGNGIFDAANDAATLDNAGAIVMKKFTVRLTNAGEEPKG